MFFHRNSSPRFLAFVKLVTLCVATALLGIWLSTNKVQAAGDAYGTLMVPLMNLAGTGITPIPVQVGRVFPINHESTTDRPKKPTRKKNNGGRSLCGSPGNGRTPLHRLVLPTRIAIGFRRTEKILCACRSTPRASFLIIEVLKCKSQSFSTI